MSTDFGVSLQMCLTAHPLPMEARTWWSSLGRSWHWTASPARMTSRLCPTCGICSPCIRTPSLRWVEGLLRVEFLGPQIHNQCLLPCCKSAIKKSLSFLCLVENQLWRPDYRIQSDIWNVQVPVDRHRQQRPVRLHQGHRPGSYPRAVWAWVWGSPSMIYRIDIFHHVRTEELHKIWACKLNLITGCLCFVSFSANRESWGAFGARRGWVSSVNMSHTSVCLLTFVFGLFRVTCLVF